ncbi:hypothetical protein ACFQY7_11745 [Actinomadura luteofluorescens]|uniref:hypothetical protein n=1 Tax=Actinomadura luteofluorescens TaxID=46163 RepID=UPI00363020DD
MPLDVGQRPPPARQQIGQRTRRPRRPVGARIGQLGLPQRVVAAAAQCATASSTCCRSRARSPSDRSAIASWIIRSRAS